MLTLNDLYKELKELKTQRADEVANHQKKIEAFDRGINEITEKVELAKDMTELELSGSQYFKTINATTPTRLKEAIQFTIEQIEDGNLEKILEDSQTIGYFYNSGFRSGHIRLIPIYHGERYAVRRSEIQFSDELYSTAKVDNKDYVSILAYLNYLLSESNKSDKASTLIGSVVKVEDDYYIVTKNAEGDTLLTDIERNYGGRLFNNYDFDRMKYTVVLSGSEYKDNGIVNMDHFRFSNDFTYIGGRQFEKINKGEKHHEF